MRFVFVLLITGTLSISLNLKAGAQNQDPPAAKPIAGGNATPITAVEAQGESEENELDSLSIQTYNVQRVLSRIAKETGKQPIEAEQWLKMRLTKRLQRSPSDGQAVAQLAGTVAGIPLDENGNGISVEAGKATIVCTNANHQQVHAMLRTLEEFGLRQVVIRAIIVKTTPEIVQNSLPIEWSHVETSSPVAKDSFLTPSSPSVPEVKAERLPTLRVDPAAPDKTTASKVVPSSYLTYREIPSSKVLVRPDDVQGANWTQAYSIVERAN
ncbi:MAG: hypothetical protein AAF483_28465, partial [Planctomycetota bacterium]